MRMRGARGWVLRGCTLAVCALLVASAVAADSPERAQVTFAPTRAVLVLIPGAEAARALAQHKLAGIDPSSAQEAELLRECSNGETQSSVTSRFFFLGIITQTWQVLLHPLAVAVRDELAKYASVSSASASGDYYRAADSSAPLNNHISCLRFTRFVNADAGEDVALDFIASVKLDTPRDAIRLRPLRLYISQAGAKSANGHYSVAISVRANAVWRDEFSGHSGQVFEQSAAAESLDLKSGPFLKYYPTDAQSGTRLPIVPVSFGLDRTQDFGRAEFTVSVAELGTQPATLKLLADMLPDPNEKMSGTVIAAAIVGQIH
jgi:hypothetical protein